MHRSCILGALMFAVFCGGTAWAQPPLDAELAYEYMAEEGRWIEVDGSMEADGTFLAKEVEIIQLEDTGNMEDTQIYGGIRKIDRRRSTMMVLGYRVEWDAQTTFKDENKRVILSSKLKNGMGVKLQGTLTSDGIFKATKIKRKIGKIRDNKEKAKEKLVGPVEVLDARDGWLRILNTTIKVRPDARFTLVPLEIATENP